MQLPANDRRELVGRALDVVVHDPVVEAVLLLLLASREVEAHLNLARAFGCSLAQAPLQLMLADNSEFPHRGHIENSVNQVDPKTGTLELQATFPNPQHILLPGQFGKVRVETELRKNAVLVPQRAVQQLQSMQTVFTVGSGNQVEMRAITTGERVGDDWIIEQGLKPGDRVIVEGQLKVRPGMTVNPAAYHGPAGATGGAAR